MRVWGALASIALVVIAAMLFLRHDLRGWTPNGDPHNPATVVEAARPGGAAFAIAECVPGTIDPYDTPTLDEYSGTATVTVLSCRSRSSAIAVILAYVIVAGIALVILRAERRRREAARGKPPGILPTPPKGNTK